MVRQVQSTLRWLSIGLVAGALVRELRTPSERRAWHGELAGFIPYDFRPPTLERLARSLWNPDDPRLLTPMVFGVGWSVNLARAARLARSALAQ
ncbi:MAG: hypothetical protein HY690_04295 [Chloroflexi bacterium]|nr:hypothetical protein [Chloroflexota bacterium]